jgi:phenylacetic acid degradation operon negative regulatory protein
MLSFFGDHVLGRRVCVFSGSIIEVLSRVGVSEEATRSTLSRMAQRGLLRRQRRGRRIYFGLTPRSIAILEDGDTRIWKTGVVNRDKNGSFTLLGFSLPEAWQRQRHDLRSRLTWAGFGPLQGGMWIAPAEVDVRALLHELSLDARVKVFVAKPLPPTDIVQLLRDAYDLEALSAHYRAFLHRWEGRRPSTNAPDALTRKLLLTTEWLQIVRHDPRLPVHLLPSDWPAVRAQRVFKKLDASYEELARSIAESSFDTIPSGTAPSGRRSNRRSA